MSGETQSRRVSAGVKAGRTGKAEPGSKSNRRRWIRRLVAALVVLAALVFSLPYLVSTGPGTSLALFVANGRIDGRIEADDLSVTWLGPCRIKGLRVTDPAGREVVNVEAVECTPGVLHAVRSWERLKRVSVDTPRVVLYVRSKGAGGGTSLAAAFRRADRPRKDKPDESLPPLTGRLRINGGSVRIVTPDGRSRQLRDVTADLDLQQMDRLAGKLSVVLPGDGRLRASFDVSGMTREGELAFDQTAGRVRLATDGQVNLAPLAEAAGLAGLRGRGRLTVNTRFSPEKVSADAEAVLANLAVSTDRLRTVKPIEQIRLTARVKLAGEDVQADASLAGRQGTLTAGGSFRLDRPPTEVDAAKLIRAVLASEPVTLPEFTCHADGSVDLAEFAAAMPGVLRVRRDVRVTGGTLQITGLSVRGGASPRASGTVAVRGLKGERAGRPVTVAPLVASLDVDSDPRAGLRIRGADVTSDALRVSASGSIQTLQVTFDTDLDRLRQDLSEIIEMEGLTLAGHVGGSAKVRAADADRLELTLNAHAAGLEYAAGGVRVNLPQATVAHTGVLTRRAGNPERYTASAAVVVVDGALKASGMGFYDLADGSFHAAADIERAEIAPLTAAVSIAKAGDLSGYAGSAAGKVTLDRAAGAGAPIHTSGQLDITGLRAGGEEISAAPVQARWEGVELGADGAIRAARSVRVRGDFATVDVKNASVRLGDWPALAGQFRIAADLARCLKLARAFAPPGKLPTIDGQLEARGTAAMAGGRMTFEGDAKVTRAQRVVLAAAGKGFSDSGTGAIGANVDVTRVDLAYAGAAAGPFGPAGLTRLAGEVDGAVEISRANAGAPLVAGGRLAGRDLAVDGKAVPGGQFKLRWVKAGFTPTGKDVSVESLLLESDMAGVNASGVRVRWAGAVEASGKLDATADLAACHAAARPFLRGDGPAPTGWLSLTGNLRTSQGRIEVTGQARIRELRRPAGEAGPVPAVEASVAGWYAPATGGFGGDANVTRADLAYLGRLGRTFGRRELEPYAGIVQVRTTFSRRAAGAPIAASGAGKLAGLHVNGQAVDGSDATFEWSGAEVAADGKHLAAAKIEVRSVLASLSAEKVRCDLGEEFIAAGSVGIGADLGRCLAVAAPLAGWRRTPPLRGRARFTALVRSAGGAVDVAGGGHVADFQYGTGAKVLQDKRIDLNVEGRVDPGDRTITLKALRVRSDLLTATAEGKVGGYDTRRVVDLKGQYRLDWKAALAILHAFEPKTAETILVTGASASPFVASGPLRQEGVRSPLGGLDAGANVGWASAKVYGVALDKAELAPRLSSGLLTLPETTIGASGGKVRLGGEVDFTGTEPALRIARLQVMENVPVSVEVGELILSRFNPIFGKVNLARLDGHVSLSLRGVDVPLSESIKRRGAGAGRLDMRMVKMAPTGPLGELVKLGGLTTGAQPVKVGGTDFTIREGRIWYKDFAVVFADTFDLHFSGSVGFDDSLDLVVRVPIRADLLAKLGVRGVAGRVAQVLQGEYVSVPLRGTRAKPELDWKRVDVKPLVSKALQSILLNGGRLPDPGSAPKPGPAPAPEADPLGDILDMLQKGLEGREKK